MLEAESKVGVAQDREKRTPEEQRHREHGDQQDELEDHEVLEEAVEQPFDGGAVEQLVDEQRRQQHHLGAGTVTSSQAPLSQVRTARCPRRWCRCRRAAAS